MTLINFKNAIETKINNEYKIEFYEEIDSTNTLLKNMICDKKNDVSCVIAKSQTRGKGTQGRSFFSYNGGIYLSLKISPEMISSNSELVTIVTAVAVLKAIKKITKIKCGIKWVNDIFLKDKKVGGILTEGEFDKSTNKLKYIIVGIGINLFQPKEDFPKALEGNYSTLLNSEFDEKIYLDLITEIIKNCYKNYKVLNSKKHIKIYKKNLVFKRKEIVYTENGIDLKGKLLGIDNKAHLIIKVQGKIKKIFAGQISIKTSNCNISLT